MNCVYVRNLRLGEGTPKVCIPLVGASDEALFEEIKALSSYPADLVEWRTDYMNDIFNEGRLTGLLPRLRKHLGNTPLIFTFRTTKEGGQRQASPQQYKTLAMEAIASGCIDLIDIELFSDPDSITELTALAKEKGVKLLLPVDTVIADDFSNDANSKVVKAGSRYCKNRRDAPVSGRCAYAAYSYRYSPTPAHLSCSHHGHGGNRAHQPCLGGNLWLLSYFWSGRTGIRSRTDRCQRAKMCAGYSS